MNTTKNDSSPINHIAQLPDMTLRDYFAAQAMQGICALSPSNDFTNEQLARDAYNLADAMLQARSV